ncbi:hypothetical protein JST97_32120 [bacterium]|nr:hypothetical protein [bacterium]
MKHLMLFLVLSQAALADSTTSASQQLELIIAPAPLQLSTGLLPNGPFQSLPRNAEAQLVWTRERIGNDEVVTLSVAPSDQPLAQP